MGGIVRGYIRTPGLLNHIFPFLLSLPSTTAGAQLLPSRLGRGDGQNGERRKVVVLYHQFQAFDRMVLVILPRKKNNLKNALRTFFVVSPSVLGVFETFKGALLEPHFKIILIRSDNPCKASPCLLYSLLLVLFSLLFFQKGSHSVASLAQTSPCFPLSPPSVELQAIAF